jgi:OFA family oxalate/formate antiporter-like MFS transporter
LLYTAKGAASFLVPAASWLQVATGSWHAVFVVATIANLVVAGAALFVIKPLRAAMAAQPEVLESAPVKVPLTTGS